MLCWSLEDDFVISSGTDYIIRVWNWETGQVVREMLGHENDAFVLTAHPIYKEFIFTVWTDKKCYWLCFIFLESKIDG